MTDYELVALKKRVASAKEDLAHAQQVYIAHANAMWAAQQRLYEAETALATAIKKVRR